MAAKKRKNKRNKLTVRSGRSILGRIEKVGKAFTWKGNRRGDSGITTSLKNAKKLIEEDAGMSPRQYDIKVYRDK